MATVSAMNRMEIPIERGFIIINMFIAREEIIKISSVIIYNYEDCTHSLNIKGLCALYTNLYKVTLFINKCIDISKFRLRLQSVSIMLLLRNQNDDCLKNDGKLRGWDILRGMLIQLIHGRREILWQQRM